MLFVLLLGCLSMQALCGASKETSALIIHKKSDPTVATAYGTFSIERTTKTEILRRISDAASYNDFFDVPCKLKNHEKKMVEAYLAPQTLQALGTLRAVAFIKNWPQVEQDTITELINIVQKKVN